MTPDIRISDQGSIVLFTPISDDAKAWWAEGVEYPDWSVLGGLDGDQYAVEHRMANAIYIGLVEAGFNIQGE